jgi:hypothetical protein
MLLANSTEYRFSEYKAPLRFAKVVDPQNFDRSSGGFKFISETPKAFTALPNGANTLEVGLFTDQSFYSITGLDAYALMRPSLVSQTGTSSGKSVITRRGETFFLDDVLHIAQVPFSQTVRARSIDVKNILEGIPSTRISYVNSAVFNDRLYMFYTPSGVTVNNSAFVIDLTNGSLVRDYYGATKGVVTTFMFEGAFVACHSDGTMAQLESDTAASVTSCSLVSREIVAFEDTWLADRQRFFTSDATMTPTAAWYAYPSGSSVTDSISFNSAGTDVRTDRFTGLSKGIRGKSIQFGLSGAMVSSTQIYAWQVETENRVSAGDV